MTVGSLSVGQSVSRAVCQLGSLSVGQSVSWAVCQLGILKISIVFGTEAWQHPPLRLLRLLRHCVRNRPDLPTTGLYAAVHGSRCVAMCASLCCVS